MKLAHGIVQVANQPRHRLRAYQFAGQGAHHPAHLPRRQPAQKRFPNQHRQLRRFSLELLQAGR